MKKIRKVKNLEIYKKRNNNIISILILLIGIMIGIAGTIVFYPKNTPRLKDNDTRVITIDNYDLKSDDLYINLKAKSGLSSALNIIDEIILKDKYNLEKEARSESVKQAKSYYDLYKQNANMSKKEFLESNGFAKEEEFIDFLIFDYYKNEYYKDYLKSQIKDKDINKYYNEKVFGDANITIYSSDTKEDLDGVAKLLSKGKKKNISDKYPKVVINDLEKFNFVTQINYSDAFIKQVKTLKKKEFSRIFEDETFGYTIIYINDKKDKDKLEDIKEDIIEAISNELNVEDETLYDKSFVDLRKKYNMKILDKDLSREYKSFVKGL